MGIDLLGCIASTTTLSRLRASMFGSVWGVAPGLRVDSGGTALQEVVTVNGLMIPVTARSFSVPSCSIAHSVTEDDAMDDSADIPAARDDTVPPVRCRASISSCDSAVVREPSFIFIGLSLRNS